MNIEDRKINGNAHGFRPDGEWNNIAVEVKKGIHDIRNLRASLMSMAYWLAKNPTMEGFIVLTDTRLTEERLQKELHVSSEIFPERISNRLHVGIIKNGELNGITLPNDNQFQTWFTQLLEQEQKQGKPRGAFFGILEILILQWIWKKGAVTTEWITRMAGCSYPTAANALRKLDYCLKRTSDKKVELKYFPNEEWNRLLSNQDEIRDTVRFTDRSGKPRTVEALTQKLKALHRPDVAIGGVSGARFYAGIDLIGTPRLDISIHASTIHPDLRFVQLLDPALERTITRGEPAILVVHFVHRAASFFQKGPDGTLWADPVECLLDLHDDRLESQAEELLRSLLTMKEIHRG